MIIVVLLSIADIFGLIDIHVDVFIVVLDFLIAEIVERVCSDLVIIAAGVVVIVLDEGGKAELIEF